MTDQALLPDPTSLHLLYRERDVIHLIDAVERNEEDKDRKEGPPSEPNPK
jgi:hypothetical protein